MGDDGEKRYIETLYGAREHLGRERFVAPFRGEDFGPVVDDDVARLLALLVATKRPRRILELGTSLGFAAASMAREVRHYGGAVVTVEFDPRAAAAARENFAQWGVAPHITVVEGDAREVLPTLAGPFDLVFLDLCKDLYPVLLDPILKILAPGGLLVAEDALFPVLDLEPRWHDLRAPIDRFNRLVVEDETLVSTILPVGDGVLLATKR